MPKVFVGAYLVTMLTQLKTVAISPLRRNTMPTDIYLFKTNNGNTRKNSA